MEASNDLVDWVKSNRLFMLRGSEIVNAPFSDSPFPFPQRCFEQAQSLTQHFNTLVHKLCTDPEFLISICRPIAEQDAFVQHLLSLYETIVCQEASPQRLLGLFRYDYMLTQSTQGAPPALKQVEMNLISCAFGPLGTLVSRRHQMMHGDQVPDNGAWEGMVDAMARAHRVYLDMEEHPGTDNSKRPAPAVLCINERAEGNVADQHHLITLLRERHGIQAICATLHDIATHSTLSPKGHLLYTHTPHGDTPCKSYEITLCYFRTGYIPKFYPSESLWDARAMIERGKCFRCPTVGAQLVNFKRVQQVLALPGVLERFFPAAESRIAADLRAVFAGQDSLEPSDYLPDSPLAPYLHRAGTDSVDRVLIQLRAQPHRYVLKPQREGGGNNLYDAEITALLDSAQTRPEELSRFTVMERLFPPQLPTRVRLGMRFTQHPAYAWDSFARESRVADPGRAEQVPQAVTELGTWGALVCHEQECCMNACVGHLLRTKSAVHNDGGVASGVAFLDAPRLVTDEEYLRLLGQ
eukprot:gnl/Trimastix_PCT/4079.p1 GENE.gnl/Trimastix_PCT/4079~~gnl/Trimastix_PCT/4079.p1  ORF type:complete len:524 (+),score=101.12 gnl/Trimastix_PCT/4079:37-1608(+)